MHRRLAAILAADVVMVTDEIGTIMSLKSHRRELVDSDIAEHHGCTEGQNDAMAFRTFNHRLNRRLAAPEFHIQRGQSIVW
jgi:hypothetical protein